MEQNKVEITVTSELIFPVLSETDKQRYVTSVYENGVFQFYLIPKDILNRFRHKVVDISYNDIIVQ